MEFKTFALSKLKRNHYLLAPKNYCASEPHKVSPIFDFSTEELKNRWMSMITWQKRIEVGPGNDGTMQYNYIQRSKWFRFPDKITVQFISLGAQKSTLAVYSRSVFGQRDFGVNKKRVSSWLSILTNPRCLPRQA